jgi:hypothetical protein
MRFLSEPLQIDQIADTFAEMADEVPSTRNVLLLVLDAANIGWDYCEGKAFAAEGVLLAIEQLQASFGSLIDIRAFLPAHYCRQKPRDGTRGNALMQTESVDILNDLIDRRLLATVPSEDSDDAYILNYARVHGGFVVSNDRFQDHLNRIEDVSVRTAMFLWLQANRTTYMFQGDEFILNPNSNLNFALRTRAAAEAGTPVFLARNEQSVVFHLSIAVEELFRLHRPLELKFVLLARAHINVEVSTVV